MPEGWLCHFDSKPRVIPHWPESQRMTLVAVVVKDLGLPGETESEAFVITDREQADRLVDFSGEEEPVATLFFRVPRSVVLNPEVCPNGLTEGSWK